MHGVHKLHKLLGCTVAGCGRIISVDPATAYATERVLRDRQKRYMRIAHLLNIASKLGGNLGVSVKASVLTALPGTEMHFVDVDGVSIKRIRHGISSILHPSPVAPPIRWNLSYKRGGRGRQFGKSTVRVRFQEFAMCRQDSVFIKTALSEQLRIKLRFPNAAISDTPHRCGFAPTVKITGNINLRGMGSPNTKNIGCPFLSGLTLSCSGMATHIFICFIIDPLVEKRRSRCLFC